MSILQFEQVRRKTHSAQSRYHSSELDEGADALEDAHVRPADLLSKESASQSLVRSERRTRTNAAQSSISALAHPDELEFCILWQLLHPLDHPKHRRDDIDCRVPCLPQLVDPRERLVDLALLTLPDQLADLDRMGLVADLVHVLGGDEAETGMCRLEIVDRLTHIAFGSEDEGLKALIR